MVEQTPSIPGAERAVGAQLMRSYGVSVICEGVERTHGCLARTCQSRSGIHRSPAGGPAPPTDLVAWSTAEAPTRTGR